MNKYKNNLDNKAYRSSYNVFDAGINFTGVLLVPFIAIVILTILNSVLAVVFNIPYSDFINITAVKIISQALVHVSFLAVFLIYNKKARITPIVACHIKKDLKVKKVLVVIIMSVLTIFLLVPFVNIIDYLFNLMGYNPSSELPIAINTFGNFMIGVLIFAILPAIIEELIFRGVILNGLQSKFSDKNAVLLSALMFMLIHGSLQQTFYQFILGLVLALIMITTKNLWYPIIFHFVNNFTVVLIQYISSFNSSGGEEAVSMISPALIIIAVLFLIAFVIITILLLLQLTNNPKQNLKDIIKNKKIDFNAISEPVDNIILINDQQTTSSTESPTIVIDNDVKKGGLEKLTVNEKAVLYFGLGISIVIWLLNTLNL